GQVTDAKVTGVAWGKVTNRPATFPPDPHDHALGGDLSGSLSAAQIVAGAVGQVELAAGAVTGEKMAAVAGPAVIGRAQGNGSPGIISAGADGTVLLRVGGSLSFAAITDAVVGAGAGIAWSKISKSGATPADVGAAPAAHSHPLATLPDVAIAGASDGQALVFSGGAWRNGAGSGGAPTLQPHSVLANPTAVAALGVSVAAADDHRLLMRLGGAIQFARATRASLEPGQACSVLGNVSAFSGDVVDIAAQVDDVVLMRANATLQWAETITRMRFGGASNGLVRFINSGGVASHEYEAVNTVQAWKQLANGRTRFYWNPTDFWEIRASGATIEIGGYIGGTQRHRIVLDASLPLGGSNRTLSLREIDVCEGGVAKKMTILASAAY
ncbi:MAG: hypothetical protein H0X45_09125, partial [Planctomycetes bacterium]|nr:hypothetical protein [Planctomycetota bacterium]